MFPICIRLDLWKGRYAQRSCNTGRVIHYRCEIASISLRGQPPHDKESIQLLNLAGKCFKELHLQTLRRCWRGQVAVMGRNGELVMSGSDDGRIFIWERATGKLVNMLVADDTSALCAVPHPQLPCLASAGSGGIVRMWSPEACSLTAQWQAFAVTVGMGLCPCCNYHVGPSNNQSAIGCPVSGKGPEFLFARNFCMI